MSKQQLFNRHYYAYIIAETTEVIQALEPPGLFIICYVMLQKWFCFKRTNEHTKGNERSTCCALPKNMFS